MKTIGLIGGMSFESSKQYYQIINQYTNQRLGKLHSCKCIMYSVDFEEIVALQENNKWDKVADILVEAAQALERAGADFIVICANTVHKVADKVQNNIKIPLLHIIDATAAEIKKQQLKKVALLGTKYTMQQSFYKQRLKEKNNVEVITPNAEEILFIHDLIHNEIALGKTNQTSKNKLKAIITRLVQEGAEGVILGCTEIPLLIKQKDIHIPTFDTLTLHAKAAVDYAFEKER
ncbi:aspartate/glutamate racemase family protein [Candidatus Woesearchaeota archaeon]|nr:aspartate/glutamate racemase family protein [Candidatus Woesearchaeota archaeon]